MNHRVVCIKNLYYNLTSPYFLFEEVIMGLQNDSFENFFKL
jgi:hypothetical protein